MKIQQNFAKITKKSQKLMVRKTANLSLERCKSLQIMYMLKNASFLPTITPLYPEQAQSHEPVFVAFALAY